MVIAWKLEGPLGIKGPLDMNIGVPPLGVWFTCKLLGMNKKSQERIELLTSMVKSQCINHPTTISHDDK